MFIKTCYNIILYVLGQTIYPVTGSEFLKIIKKHHEKYEK